MQTQTATRHYTPEEYLALEEVAEFKNEYRNGKIIPMTGGTTNHNQIAGNFYALLKFALKGQNYRIFMGDVRLWIPNAQVYTYPDIMLIEGKPIYHQNRTDTITNSLVIVEVLSQSTKAYDRSEKFDYYRSIPEFKGYILVDQYKIHVEHYFKTAEEKWLLTYYESPDSILSLSSVNFQIPMNDLYEQVDFELKEG